MKKQYIIISVILLSSLFVFIFFGKSKRLSVSFKPNKNESGLQLKNATLKVYIENSGSMDGYVCSGSEFRDAIKGYVSSFEMECNKIELFYINTQVIPISNNVKQFINNLTPSSFVKYGGNRVNTDMGQLISTLLESANDSTISIFVSDCILDVSKNSKDYFTDRQIDITNAAKKFNKKGNNSVEIIQLRSHFLGNYYAQDGISKLDDYRPYYIWIFGKNELLQAMNQITPIENITHGVLNWASFNKSQEVSFDIKNKFGQDPINMIPSHGYYQVMINANLSPLLKTNDVLCLPNSYSTNNNRSVKIESIFPMEGNKLYSHVLSLSIAENIKSTSELINLIGINNVPGWVSSTNDDTGVNIKANMNKTTGFRYLVEGIADAYKSEKVTGNINFEIKSN